MVLGTRISNRAVRFGRCVFIGWGYGTWENHSFKCPYLILLGAFHGLFVIIMRACACLFVSSRLSQGHLVHLPSYWQHRYYVVVLTTWRGNSQEGRLQYITRNGRGFNDHTSTHPIQCIWIEMMYFYWLTRRKCPARPSSDGPSLCLIHGTVLSPSNIPTTYLHTPYECLKIWKILDARFNMSQTVSWDIPNSFSVNSKSAKFHAKSSKVDQTAGVKDLKEVSCPIMP